MPLGASLLGTAMVLGNVLVLAGSGAYLRRRGYIDQRGTVMLGRVVMTVLLPCLLMTKLASTDLHTMRRALGVPLFSVLFVGVAFVGGLLLSHLLALKEDFRRAFVVGCAFGNATSIPLVILTAVLTSYPSMRAFKAHDAIAYASLYMPTQHILLWSLGYGYLAAGQDDDLLETGSQERSPLLPAPLQPGFGAATATLWMLREKWEVFRQRLNAPLVGIGLGLGVALLPPLHRVWVPPFGSLGWLKEAVGMLGAASIPVNMMCLGSNVSQGPNRAAAGLPLALICVFRLVLLPVVGIGLAWGLCRAGLLPRDRLILLTCLVETSTPTANNVVTIATALDRGAAEISACLFWQYVCFVGVQMFVLPLFMHLVECWAPT
eukprot:EG_transcript_13572